MPNYLVQDWPSLTNEWYHVQKTAYATSTTTYCGVWRPATVASKSIVTAKLSPQNNLCLKNEHLRVLYRRQGLVLSYTRKNRKECVGRQRISSHIWFQKAMTDQKLLIIKETPREMAQDGMGPPPTGIWDGQGFCTKHAMEELGGEEHHSGMPQAGLAVRVPHQWGGSSILAS